MNPMENFKVKVGSEAESKEAQELFFELGCYWGVEGNNGKTYIDIKQFTHLSISNKRLGMGYGSVGYKEITIPQLKDMVVLKRNNPNDLNVVDTNLRDSDLYLTCGGDLYYHTGAGWALSNLNGNENYYDILKPIEKEMKEYINKTTGEYKKANCMFGHSEWVEVPNHYNIAVKKINGDIRFTNEIGTYFGELIIWQRPQQPDSLPFVDDEQYNPDYDDCDDESLSDKLTSIEVARQELKGVDATLAERQATYGSFEDVATVTQDLLSVLKRTGLESLPAPHKEALHMICSKMARIVNGDYNHLDSWHDIGGYAKLIESLDG